MMKDLGGVVRGGQNVERSLEEPIASREQKLDAFSLPQDHLDMRMLFGRENYGGIMFSVFLSDLVMDS